MRNLARMERSYSGKFIQNNETGPKNNNIYSMT